LYKYYNTFQNRKYDLNSKKVALKCRLDQKVFLNVNLYFLKLFSKAVGVYPDVD